MDPQQQNPIIEGIWHAMDLGADEGDVRDVVDQAIKTYEPDPDQGGGRMTTDPSASVITRTYFGGMEVISWDEWATNVIQDREVALEVAERMLAKPEIEYDWNEGIDRFYETFLIADLDGFKRAYERAKEEMS